MSNHLISSILFATSVATTFGACGASEETDELTADDAIALDDSKADGTGTYTYYFVQQDDRRCISPLCGGVFYRLANANLTRCLDGTKQPQCYAANADWTRLQLDDSGLAKVSASVGSLLVRATIGSKNWGSPFGMYAELRPREAWPGQIDVEHDGVLVKIENTGVRCSAAPCPTFRERKLNSSLRAELAELGWDAGGATDDQITEGVDAMFSNNLIIAGNRYKVSGPAGSAKARTVDQFWLRATNDQCQIIDCAAPPSNCHYEGMISTPCDQQTCGQLVCSGSPF